METIASMKELDEILYAVLFDRYGFIDDEFKKAIDNIYVALGACDTCYGKGYLEEKHAWCDCLRGEELERYLRT